jgi:hypothetical protein
MTEDQAKQYVEAAPDALEKRLRLLEVGMVRHTTLLEQVRELLAKFADRQIQHEKWTVQQLDKLTDALLPSQAARRGIVEHSARAPEASRAGSAALDPTGSSTQRAVRPMQARSHLREGGRSASRWSGASRCGVRSGRVTDHLPADSGWSESDSTPHPKRTGTRESEVTWVDGKCQLLCVVRGRIWISGGLTRDY